jgi:hypothetical protein
MICAHCEQPLTTVEEMTLLGCASGPETVCAKCWTAATLPYDCLQCVAELSEGRIG